MKGYFIQRRYLYHMWRIGVSWLGGRRHFSPLGSQNSLQVVAVLSACIRESVSLGGGLISMLNRVRLFVVIVPLLLTAVVHAQPATPTLKSPVTADKAVQLTWSAEPSATSYNIYWGTTPGVSKGNAIGNANQLGVAWSVPSLTNGTQYYFVVTAVNAKGESALSNEVSATPVLLPAARDNTATAASQPTTNVGSPPDTNVQTPTMVFASFTPVSYPVVSATAGSPNGKITYDPVGLDNLIKNACTTAFRSGADFDTAFNDGRTYTIINVINLNGSASAQTVASNNWYLYSKHKVFANGFAGGWKLADFDGATRLYGVKKVLLLSILENNLTPVGSDSPSIGYTLTVTKQQPTNVANVLQLLGLVFPQAPAAAIAAVPASYWACSSVPIAYSTSTIKIGLSYTAGGGSPYTASQGFTSEAKQYWDVSFALPVKKASALEYSSSGNTVTASQINKNDLFAAIDVYPYPVDLVNNKFNFIPGFFAGVALNSQPLHSLIFGGSVGLKLAQVYVGALLIKQQQLTGLSTGSSATPTQVNSAISYSYEPSFSVGIKISIKAAAAAISGSK